MTAFEDVLARVTLRQQMMPRTDWKVYDDG